MASKRSLHPAQLELPRHLAIIMDGSGRWASARGLPRLAGHRAGATAVRQIVRLCRKRGLRHLSLYTFSSENWLRPAEEVRGLMALLEAYLRSERRSLVNNEIELAAIGDLDRLPAPVRRVLEEVQRETSGLGGMRLNLALSYGGRDELVRATRRLAACVADGLLRPEHVDASLIGGLLDTSDIPDPDLVIRTGGECRLSNFMLWQAAYSELLFTDLYWPDFGADELDAALAWYSGRSRRFGRVGKAPIAFSHWANRAGVR